MASEIRNVDVVIVGAGPSGLMAGAWMAQTGNTAIILEKEASRTQYGHADGIESRTFEILDSFGMGEEIWNKANRTIDLSIWNDDEHGEITRSTVRENCNPALSRFQEATLGQGQIEQTFLDFIDASHLVAVKWNTGPIDLTVCEESDYPVRVVVATRVPGAQCEEIVHSTIRAKFVIGCDGAHSWVRKTLGLGLDGDQMNENWGVFDSIPLTTFPDIRRRCIVKSAAGHLMIIPREGRLVRFYVQLPPGTEQRFKAKNDASEFVNVVKKALRPYKFDASSIEWSTVYSVGQRLCTTYSLYNRVFLAGDALHTHSPKAGQGMNVSIQDTYNLGWKLAYVIKGKAKASILRTYQGERLPIAKRLLDFDKRMVEGIREKAHASCTKCSLPANGTFEDTLREENTSASGLTVCYKPSCLITKAWKSRNCSQGIPLLPYSRTKLATNIVVGARFPNAQVLFQCDSRPCNLQQVLRSTGEWHMIVFGGDLLGGSQMRRVQRLGLRLSQDMFWSKRVNLNCDDRVGHIGAYLVHCAPRKSVDMMELPEIFRPFDQVTGFDYWKVFADNNSCSENCGGAYQAYGIGTEGCLVLVRPDQHVAFVGALDDLSAMELFLQNFML
ncbi:hypothetical protein POX_c04348 [Penicillium oxalicum]|uniref:hypothetical protein n=1 Tax=Penicillium oxalicum TaxID=69781 RepID=UPI0020B86570|nr:hypothetical protein POX_c04348 [Penicillium oxalicum]KAI2791487.1 hypothetical protein POX_c04348 [Penicillium oxalicum]